MNSLQTTATNLTPQQLDLIKATIAKNATDDELQLFLYRAKSMGLDPLKSGQIHFVKYGSGPGSIVVGIDGFRSKAAASGKHSGTKRGVTYDSEGNCISAWCEVYRSDWQQPAREEVSMHEYNTGKGPWAKMPETMLKKVAEAAALRMAFPDTLGGIYAPEEMNQASDGLAARPRTGSETIHDLANRPAERLAKPETPPENAGDHVIRIGKKYVGSKLSDLRKEELSSFMDWILTKADDRFRDNPDTKEFLFYAETYLAEGEPLFGTEEFNKQ